MTALRKPSQFAGLQQFDYTLNGVFLECWVEYEKGEKATWHEPGEPESATLFYAIHNGDDIAEILSNEQRDQIEIAFLEQPQND